MNMGNESNPERVKHEAPSSADPTSLRQLKGIADSLRAWRQPSEDHSEAVEAVEWEQSELDAQ